MTVQMIRSTSYSRLVDFESCKLKAKLKIIDRIPEPERPLPPGKTEHANDRGTRIHNECESYVRGKGQLPVEASKYFTEDFRALKRCFTEGAASLEGEWAFDTDWNPVDWKTGWLRVKLDASVILTPTHAVVVDYKTGKRFGNEIKHGQQLELYALSSLIRYPEVEHVTCELWYLDFDEIARLDVTRDSFKRLLKAYDRRFHRMTSAKEFPPSPNLESCRYCPYHPVRGTGDCKVGV